MDLALDVGVSTRHLSFIETGRSRPSPAMLMALSERLQVPLRERNRLLLSAGYAPQFGEEKLDAPAMAPVRDALARLLAAHDPYPGLVLDGLYNIVQMNQSAARMMAILPPALQTAPQASPLPNIIRLSLHPDGLAKHTTNFPDWAWYLLDTLGRQVQQSADADLAALQREVLAYPNVARLMQLPRAAATGAPALLVPCEMTFPFGRLSLFTTLSTFGTPRDITLAETSVEMFYPADAASEALLRALAAA